jgi:hypothetical protein
MWNEVIVLTLSPEVCFTCEAGMLVRESQPRMLSAKSLEVLQAHWQAMQFAK